MQGEILIAVLSFLGTCLGSWGGLKLMSYRIEQLEKKVEKHNTVIERVFKLEQKVSDMEDHIKLCIQCISTLAKTEKFI